MASSLPAIFATLYVEREAKILSNRLFLSLSVHWGRKKQTKESLERWWIPFRSPKILCLVIFCCFLRGGRRRRVQHRQNCATNDKEMDVSLDLFFISFLSLSSSIFFFFKDFSFYLKKYIYFWCCCSTRSFCDSWSGI